MPKASEEKSETQQNGDTIPKEGEKQLKRAGRSKPGKQDLQNDQGIIWKGALGEKETEAALKDRDQDEFEDKDGARAEKEGEETEDEKKVNQ